MTRAQLAFIVCVAPAFATFEAAAQQDVDGAFDRTPQDCISVSSIDETDAVDDQNLLFYMRDGRVYRNHLPRKCPGLERENRIAYKIQGSRRLCSINTITVLEDGIGAGGIGGLRDGFTCRLGSFVPLSPEEIEDLDLREDEPRGGRRTQSTIETSEVELPNGAAPGEREEPAASEPEPQAGARDD